MKRNSGKSNVLVVDGHVMFDRSPILGLHHDNIYTLQTDYTVGSVIVGTVPEPDQMIGPLTQTDSFLVP